MSAIDGFWNDMEQRGISDAVSRLRWRQVGRGIEIPYIAPIEAYRWWAYPGRRTFGRIGKQAALYATHLTDWQSSMYVVEGETDYAACISEGIANVVALWGATSIKGVVEVFREAGVARVIQICDNDDAGYRCAARVRDALAGSHIDYTALSLIGFVGQKGDVGDLRASAPGVLPRALRVASPAILPPPAPLPPRRPPPENDLDAVASVVAALIARSPTRRPSRDGNNLTMRSPFREDKHASFTINERTGLAYDFATGQGWNAHQLKKELNE